MKRDNIWHRILVIGETGLIAAGLFYFMLGLWLGQDAFEFYSNYTVTAVLLIVFFCVSFYIICRFNYTKEISGVTTPLSEIVHIFDNYRFLMKQLIARDFAVKYRRSYLGIVWVILNPLLQMIVLSAVFSYVFRFDIENYPVYIILGQITFSFFNEATSVAVSTIVASGDLIKKIYIPKCIFPLSKIVFSFLNLLLSFIPVVIVLLIFRIPINIHWLYLPFYFVTLFAFTLGVGFFLAALNVQLRDTQYLYGIFTTLLIYVTPVFYPVSALSPNVQKIMRFNPVYQYISLIREIIFYNAAPSMQHIMICVLCGILTLMIGLRFFFKKQDEFILYV